MTAHILVIDDEDAVRAALRHILEPEGYHVVEASHGGIARQQYYEHPTDLVIIDLLMPEQEGLETILQIRRLSPQVKIIAISGGGRYGLTHLLQVAKQFGADRILAKPFDRPTLLAVVRELLADKAL